MKSPAMATCRAKGCSREVADGDALCTACVIEMDVLMRSEIEKRLGRPLSDAEYDIYFYRIIENLAARSAPTPKEKPHG